MEDIEYLDEYEDLIMPIITGAKVNAGIIASDDSSTYDDIFERLFDEHSEDENLVPKKNEPQPAENPDEQCVSMGSADLVVHNELESETATTLPLFETSESEAQTKTPEIATTSVMEIQLLSAKAKTALTTKPKFSVGAAATPALTFGQITVQEINKPILSRKPVQTLPFQAASNTNVPCTVTKIVDNVKPRLVAEIVDNDVLMPVIKSSDSIVQKPLIKIGDGTISKPLIKIGDGTTSKPFNKRGDTLNPIPATKIVPTTSALKKFTLRTIVTPVKPQILDPPEDPLEDPLSIDTQLFESNLSDLLSDMPDTLNADATEQLIDIGDNNAASTRKEESPQTKEKKKVSFNDVVMPIPTKKADSKCANKIEINAPQTPNTKSAATQLDSKLKTNGDAQLMTDSEVTVDLNACNVDSKDSADSPKTVGCKSTAADETQENIIVTKTSPMKKRGRPKKNSPTTLNSSEPQNQDKRRRTKSSPRDEPVQIKTRKTIVRSLSLNAPLPDKSVKLDAMVSDTAADNISDSIQSSTNANAKNVMSQLNSEKEVLSESLDKSGQQLNVSTVADAGECISAQTLVDLGAEKCKSISNKSSPSELEFAKYLEQRDTASKDTLKATMSIEPGTTLTTKDLNENTTLEATSVASVAQLEVPIQLKNPNIVRIMRRTQKKQECTLMPSITKPLPNTVAKVKAVEMENEEPKDKTNRENKKASAIELTNIETSEDNLQNKNMDLKKRNVTAKNKLALGSKMQKSNTEQVTTYKIKNCRVRLNRCDVDNYLKAHGQLADNAKLPEEVQLNVHNTSSISSPEKNAEAATKDSLPLTSYRKESQNNDRRLNKVLKRKLIKEKKEMSTKATPTIAEKSLPTKIPPSGCKLLKVNLPPCPTQNLNASALKRKQSLPQTKDEMETGKRDAIVTRTANFKQPKQMPTKRVCGRINLSALRSKTAAATKKNNIKIATLSREEHGNHEDSEINSKAHISTTSYGVPTAAVVEDGMTSIYSFLLSEGSDLPNHDNVMLDYSCPNSNGTTSTMKPSDVNTLLKSPIYDLPTATTTKPMTLNGMEDEANEVPASVYQKVNDITADGGGAALSASNKSRKKVQKQQPKENQLNRKSLAKEDSAFIGKATVVRPTETDRMLTSMHRVDTLLRTHGSKMPVLGILDRQQHLRDFIALNKFTASDVDTAFHVLTKYTDYMRQRCAGSSSDAKKTKKM